MNSIETTSNFETGIMLSKVAKRQIDQADRLGLVTEEHYLVNNYTHRLTGEQIQVVELNEDGKQQKQKLKNELFGNQYPRHKLPLGKRFDFETADSRNVYVIDNRDLAVSLIRRRIGGYYCDFLDRSATAYDQVYEFKIIPNKNPKSHTIRIIFDHWPPEFIEYAYVKEGSKYIATNEPISIGPECVIDPQILRDGKPHENLGRWFGNLLKRNLKHKP